MKTNLGEENFNIYLTSLRFIPYKVTHNIAKIYLDIDNKNKILTITSFYKEHPSEIEEELLDDICTNINAHVPNYSVEFKMNTMNNYDTKIVHDYVIFAFYEPKALPKLSQV